MMRPLLIATTYRGRLLAVGLLGILLPAVLLPDVLPPGMCGAAAWGQTPAEPDGVDTGREALRDTGSFPWYDETNDQLRRIEVKPPKAPRTSQFGNANWFFGSGDWFTPLAWTGIALLLGLIVYLLVRAFLLREKAAARAATHDDDAGVGENVDRVDQLPIKLRRPTSDLLSEARAQYQAGNYAEAIIYLYSHLLVALDKRSLIRLAKGKTNRQYLREVSTRAGLRGMLEQTMIVFEDVFFGDHRLERDRFESVWNRLDEFDTLLDEASA
jgi:hypothetical protein